MAITVTVYPEFIKALGDGAIDLANDTFKAILLNSTHAFNAAHDHKADIVANELSTANGYTAGGAAVASPTWSRSASTLTWDGTDVSWTASGGAIGPARYAVIYDDTHASDHLVLQIDFGADQTANDGFDFDLVFNASGIFTAA